MENLELLKQIKNMKIVPVVKLDRAEDALPLGEALIEGGLPVAEVTFRTDAAEASIGKLTARYPELLVGAGTVTNVDQAKRALNAGAKFLVSPGFSRAVTEFARKNRIMILPGTCTPTEVMTAIEYELPVVKFFPAEQYGGLSTIKALSAPFPSLRFMPTGGIGPHNINEYLSSPKVIACGGSWMVKDKLILEGRFDEITRLTKESVELVKDSGKGE